MANYKGKIEEIEKKTANNFNKSPYVVFTIDKLKWNCFDKNLYSQFKVGEFVEYETTLNGKFENMVSMKLSPHNEVAATDKNQPLIHAATSNIKENKNQEFHLSIEACRIAALDLAIKMGIKETALLQLSEVILEYILRGIKPNFEDART